ncbi:MAG: insulinase family protein, partial [Myxococcaceae bacterium]
MQARWLAVAVLAAAGQAWGFDVPTRLTFRDVNYDVRSVDLPSGMRVVVEKDASRPLVVVVSVVDVGGSDDPPGKEGLAHLVEHLTFRSIQDQKHPFNDLLEVAGAARWNASTSWDLTTYHEVASKDALDSLVPLEIARIARPLEGVTPEVFEAERRIVKNELLERDEQGYVSAISNRMAGALFPPGHPNSRPMTGTEESIASLTLEDARAFVKKFYRPERITLLIAGDLDPAALAKSLPARMPASFLESPASGPVAVTSRLPATPPAVEGPKSKRELIRVKAASDAPVVIVGWPLPSGYEKDGYYGRFVARMAGNASSQAIFHDSDLVSVAATPLRGRSGSMLLVLGRLRDGSDPARSAERMIDQLTQLWTNKSASGSADQVRRQEAEFLRRRNQTLVDLASDLEDVGGRAVMRAQLIHVTGDTNAITRELTSIGDLTAGSVARFAFEYLDRSRARVVFLEPDGTAASADGSGSGIFAAGPGLQLRITPEVLRARVVGPGAELRAFKLENGLEVVLARRPTAPVFTATFLARGGTADGEPLGAVTFARYASPVDSSHGHPELFGISDDTRAAKDSMSVDMLAASGNLANVVGMMLDEVRSLHVDTAVERYVDQELRSVYRKSWMVPGNVFDRGVWAGVYGAHPYGRSVTPDQYEKIGSGDAQRDLDRA